MPHLSGGLRSWLGRIARGAAVLIVVAVVSGALYQNVLLSRERRAYPMPGQLIGVGNYRMHIYCTGQGDPPVILDSGLGDSYMAWHNVQPEIAKFVLVCSYDRGGMGYSEPSPRPRTSRVFAEELHELLHAAGVSPPYILVGHSMAGYNVRIFASRYRSEMAGMVLVDGSHAAAPQKSPPALNAADSSWIRQGEFLEYTAPIGIQRLLGYCGHDAALRAAECTFNDARENAAERKTFRESAGEAATAGNLGDLPLVVISRDTDQRNPDLPADLDKATNKVWAQMQEKLSQLSTHGTLIIAKGSGHYIQDQRPEIVIEAVHNVVDRARERSALPERDGNQKR